MTDEAPGCEQKKPPHNIVMDQLEDLLGLNGVGWNAPYNETFPDGRVSVAYR